MIKKGLAVAVILLFIGVAFAPSINAVDKLYPKEDGPYFFLLLVELMEWAHQVYLIG